MVSCVNIKEVEDTRDLSRKKKAKRAIEARMRTHIVRDRIKEESICWGIGRMMGNKIF